MGPHDHRVFSDYVTEFSHDRVLPVSSTRGTFTPVILRGSASSSLPSVVRSAGPVQSKSVTVKVGCNRRRSSLTKRKCGLPEFP